ncbi:MAG: hypothetical protein AB7G15_21330 [Alphaproteobacteria bacterium]
MSTRDDIMAETAPPPTKLKRNIASLIGAFVVGIGAFVLFTLLFRDFGWIDWSQWAVSAVIAIVFGIYVRLADL